MACTTAFPIAVASTGPASTGLPVAVAVAWLRYPFWLPPPMIWTPAIGAPVSASIVRNTDAYRSASESRITLTTAGGFTGTACPVSPICSAIAASMLGGFRNRGSSG